MQQLFDAIFRAMVYLGIVLTILGWLRDAIERQHRITTRDVRVFIGVAGLVVAAPVIVPSLDMPWLYIEIIRATVTLAAVLAGMGAVKIGAPILIAPYAILAVTFNPIMVITFPRKTWLVMDGVAAVLLIATAVVPSLILRAKKQTDATGHPATTANP